MFEDQTCKITFKLGTSEKEAKRIISKYAKEEEFTIHNHYESAQIGCNKIAYSIVDLPEGVHEKLINEDTVLNVENMNSTVRCRPKRS